MKLIGDVQVFKTDLKEFEGKKYYTCLAMSEDKEVFKFSARFEDQPKEGDIFQMELSASSRDLKPFIRFTKVK